MKCKECGKEIIPNYLGTCSSCILVETVDISVKEDCKCEDRYHKKYVGFFKNRIECIKCGKVIQGDIPKSEEELEASKGCSPNFIIPVVVDMDRDW